MNNAIKALAIVVLDPKIRAFLMANDPEALKLAEKGLAETGYTFPNPEATLAWCRNHQVKR